MWKRQHWERGSPPGGPLGLLTQSLSGLRQPAASPNEVAPFSKARLGTSAPAPSLSRSTQPGYQCRRRAKPTPKGRAGQQADALGHRGGCAHGLLDPTPGSEPCKGRGWGRKAAAGLRGQSRRPGCVSSRPHGCGVSGTDLPAFSLGRFSTVDPRLWLWSPSTAH